MKNKVSSENNGFFILDEMQMLIINNSMILYKKQRIFSARNGSEPFETYKTGM